MCVTRFQIQHFHGPLILSIIYAWLALQLQHQTKRGPETRDKVTKVTGRYKPVINL